MDENRTVGCGDFASGRKRSAALARERDGRSAALAAAVHPVLGWALSAQPINWQEAVARLAQERTQAETCARLLKKYGDAAAIDWGSLTYGEAKAEYDGIIAGLGVALARKEKPASLPDLGDRLLRGLAEREAFCKSAQALVPPAPARRVCRGDREGRREGRPGLRRRHPSCSRHPFAMNLDRP